MILDVIEFAGNSRTQAPMLRIVEYEGIRPNKGGDLPLLGMACATDSDRQS
jgi:hypothetical protein